MDLQAFRRAVGAVFGLLVAEDIIDGIFRELSEQNMQLFSSVSSMASVVVSPEEGGAPVVGVSDDEETGRSAVVSLSKTADNSMKALLSAEHATQTDAKAEEPEHTIGSRKQESMNQKNYDCFGWAADSSSAPLSYENEAREAVFQMNFKRRSQLNANLITKDENRGKTEPLVAPTEEEEEAEEGIRGIAWKGASTGDDECTIYSIESTRDPRQINNHRI